MVFDLEYISNPQIAPDGQSILYSRNAKDILTDRSISNIWKIQFDGTNARPITTGTNSNSQASWSPDGKKIAYVSNKDGSRQIYLYWLEDQIEQRITHLTESPGNIQWSPDGKWISFTMHVAEPTNDLVRMPKKPTGAEWASPPVFIDKMRFKVDGAGFLPSAYRQLFTVSIDGGTPRQLTEGPYNHGGAYTWAPDSKFIIFSTNRNDDRLYEANNSEIYELEVATLKVKSLTTRKGPDNNPVVSPNGKLIAYTGYDDEYQGYQLTRLYVMNRDGSNPRLLSSALDRSISGVKWVNDNQLYFQYHDEGNTKIASIDLNGKIEVLTDNLGGLSLGRPYSGGSFTVAP